MPLALWRLLQQFCEPDGLNTDPPPRQPNGHAPEEEEENEDGDMDDPDHANKIASWRTYAGRLRKKEAAQRVKNKEMSTELADLKAKLDQQTKDHEKALADLAKDNETKSAALVAAAKKDHQSALIDTELRNIATKAGAKDVDDLLKLIDKSTISVDDKGAIVGADKVIDEAKKAKPHLFGTASSTTSNAKAPKPQDGEVTSVKDLDGDQYEAAKAALLGQPTRRAFK